MDLSSYSEKITKLTQYIEILREIKHDSEKEFSPKRSSDSLLTVRIYYGSLAVDEAIKQFTSAIDAALDRIGRPEELL